ncbi:MULTISPECIES: DUF6788 family protein [unclassified Leptolyngbya]|uniref:DUF6788 family protein n=1 Tax=unclassified Leptolyngbya TaxID=2650499 RepID=UPI0016858FD0|nr:MULTISPECIES: DUF6788 family protein [unclassified Leptolyngbya]MBD1909853.1 hypothetical protein [Leptolyngbya sp. FACHB-8]MBD2156949.1 hypothetical protein [Leptolyngbya sp. FACHB-16]
MNLDLNFDSLRRTLYALDLEQARQLRDELSVVIQTLEERSPPAPPVKTRGREIIEVRHLGIGPSARLYQLERIRCGKAGCKCAGENGKLHGPYWYVYWRDAGKLKSRYVGKRLKVEE